MLAAGSQKTIGAVMGRPVEILLQEGANEQWLREDVQKFWRAWKDDA
jgi:hypothetical protein